MPLVGHGLGILGLEEPPDVLPVLGVVVRAQVEVKAKLEVLEELAPARASGDELTPGGSELTPAAAQQLPEGLLVFIRAYSSPPPSNQKTW